jgi:hypothetical protein
MKPLNQLVPSFLSELRLRLAALLDKSAWLLILPALALLLWAYSPAVATLLQWALYVPLFAGISIIVSLLVFPQVKVQELYDAALIGNLSAALVLVALMSFYLVLLLTLLSWVRQ